LKYFKRIRSENIKLNMCRNRVWHTCFIPKWILLATRNFHSPLASWRAFVSHTAVMSNYGNDLACWINKTLLLVKQQKWLSEFCVKMLAKIRVGLVTVNTQIFFFGLMSDGYSFQTISHFVEITNGAVIFCYINNC
jgi:hypothetical protein